MIQPNQPREDNYRDVSCQKCGHIPASENHLCDNQPREEWEALFIEEGASLEHARWSKWHIYMRDKWTPENIERWNRQAVTPYSELSEKEKESDRREVREYLPLITNLLAAERAALRERIADNLKLIAEMPAPRLALVDYATLLTSNDRKQ